MPSKPESRFIDRIHRKLNKDIYKQAMGLTAVNGTPDYYYEGNAGHIWVEYKWYDNKPTYVDLCDTGKKPNLSKLQQHWLNRAYHNKQPIAVVAGFPKGCLIFVNDEWKMHLTDPIVIDLFTTTEESWVDSLNDLNL